MGRDVRREQIREGLARVWSGGGRDFATFEDAACDASFVQFLDGQLCVSWPHDRDPRELLPRLGARPPGGVRVLGWSPHGTVVMHTGDLRQDEVAGWIDVLLERVLDVRDVTVRVEADR